MSQDDFARTLLKMSASQIAMSAGYEKSKAPAIDAIVDIMEMYIKQIARKTKEITEHNRRTQSNFLDLMLSMDILDIDITKIGEYISKEDIPFIDNVPIFPVLNDNVANINQDDSISGVYDKENPHIPAFLPEFPDSRTYKNNVLYQKRQPRHVTVKKDELKASTNPSDDQVHHMIDIVSEQ